VEVGRKVEEAVQEVKVGDCARFAPRAIHDLGYEPCTPLYKHCSPVHAQAKLTEHHTLELTALRAQLADTHAQLSAAHTTELESAAAAHAAATSEMTAEHANALGAVREQLEVMRGRVGEVERALEEAMGREKGREAEGEGEVRRVREELEGVREVRAG
jgi:hypothetical protein